MCVVKSKLFTLVELLIVVAILGILLSLLLPSLRNARDVAKTAVCLANQQQVASAVFQYSTSNNHNIPPAGNDFINIIGSTTYLDAPKSDSFDGNLNVTVSSSNNPFFCAGGLEDKVSIHTKSFQWNWVDQNEVLRPWRSTKSLYLKTTGGYDTWFTAVGHHLGVDKGSSGWKYSNWRYLNPKDRWPSLLNIIEPGRSAALHDGVHHINSHLGSQNVRTPLRHRNNQRTNIVFFDGHARTVSSAKILMARNSNLDSDSDVVFKGVKF
ncbi:MAG: prepilin-type N-terminal cleavage/methylation domain-containing protein [Lentisphaeraceae bacterium]|nr:prepilin-type N-terminal cleavage/methylation domain-containing protein [Lentisphaeraceae bacterium]